MSKENNRLFHIALLVIFTVLSLNPFCIRSYSWEIDAKGAATYIVNRDTLEISEV